LVLAVLAAPVSLAFAYGGLALLAFVTVRSPIPIEWRLDERLLGFTAAMSLVTVLVFALLPALRSTRLDVHASLRQTSAGGRSADGGGLRRLLVVSQVALSLLVITFAGLFVSTLRNLERQDLGYRRDQLVVVRADMAAIGRSTSPSRVVEDLLARVGQVPGVAAVTASINGLLSGTTMKSDIAVDGFVASNDSERNCDFDLVGPDYFHTIGLPLRAGRDFTAADRVGARPVAVVNESLARRYFAGQDPIGRRILFMDGTLPLEVVGVAADARHDSMREAAPPTFYVPMLQNPDPVDSVVLEVRTAAPQVTVDKPIRDAIAQVAANIPVKLEPFDELVDRVLAQEQMVARASAFFGALALALASIGLYGVTSYAAARRTSELGIRRALGASARGIVWVVLRDSLRMVGLGVALGVPLTLALVRIVAHRLYGLGPADPVTMVTAIVMLVLVAAVAGYLPARRAARVDPALALRTE
jgi:predicted permease